MPEEITLTRKQRWKQLGQRFGEKCNTPFSCLIAASVFTGNDVQYRYTRYGEFGHHWESEDRSLVIAISIIGLIYAGIGGVGTYLLFPALCSSLGEQLGNLMDLINPETPTQNI